MRSSYGSPGKLRVLLVPDSIYWVTATIARDIARHNPWIEPTICSYAGLRFLLAKYNEFPGKVDLVHFLTPHLATEFLPYFEGKVPCVGTIHHVEDQRSTEAEPRCDAIMTVCRQWHDHLVASGVDVSKLVMMTNGVQTDLFRPPTPKERRKLKTRLGLPRDAPVVGFSAKRTSDTHNRKGTDILVRAIVNLHRRMPQVAIVVLGPGWSELVAQQREQGVRCVHLPFILDHDDLAPIYRCFDIYWVTSRIEGGPVPLLEAMSSGACCVTTPVGVARELVKHGENAFLAPIDDAESFVRHTESLVRDPELRARIGTEARRSILEAHQSHQTTRSARQLYQTAIERFRCRWPLSHAPAIPEADGKAAGKVDLRSGLPPQIRSWVAARERVCFMNQLNFMGEWESASRVAVRAIACRPFDPEILRLAGPVIAPFARARVAARRCWRLCRRLGTQLVRYSIRRAGIIAEGIGPHR